MKTRTRMSAVGAAVVFAALAGLASEGWAAYPERAVTLVVGSVPGSGPDVLARSMSEELGRNLGQPVVVENQPGAAGNVAAAAVSRSDPDGYKLFIGTINMTIATWLPKEPPFDPATDFAIVGQVASIPNIMVVTPELGVNTVDEFIVLAKEKPGEINYSSPGVGSLQHLGTDQFATATEVSMVHIPYRGGAAATKSVLANETQMFMAGMPPALPHIKSGKLIALAVSSTERSPLTPDVPTLNETVMPGYSAEAWYGIFLAKGTPDAIVNKLNAAFNEVLKDPAVIQRFNNAGAEIRTGTPQQFADLVAKESARWKKTLTDLGLAGSR